jgi:hypothetical protein
MPCGALIGRPAVVAKDRAAAGDDAETDLDRDTLSP